MPRYSRVRSVSGIYHVMLRGINKQIIFESDADRYRFVKTIDRFKVISKYEVYGYCLMSNHVHLLLKETDEPISTAIKRICSSYVYWYNWKYERCGHLFQERYKSEIVESDCHLLTVLRYIHQNPVKAGMSENAKGYPWSSYNDYVTNSKIVDADFVFSMFSADKKKAVRLFCEHTNMLNEDRCLDISEKSRLTDNAVNKYLAKLDVKSISELQQSEIKKRNEIIRELKAIEGVTIRQLARVTGISKSVIDRI